VAYRLGGCTSSHLSLFDNYDLVELHLVDDKRRVRCHYDLWRVILAFPCFLGLPQYLQQSYIRLGCR